MRVSRALVLLPVPSADLPGLEPCLEHLVAAADEASAAGIPTSLVLATSADPADLAALLAEWTPLVALLEDVDLTVDLHPATAASREELRERGTRALTALADPAGTVVLTTTCDVGVGPGWIAEHVRHHRAGATASTGPVRGTGDVHETTANLAVRADLLPAGAFLPGGPHVPGAGHRFVHALTPVVATFRVMLPASP
ncbi:hypothetical protein FHR75_001070 [Kineococcus radiotolerans]|uniref:Uncharacterized protein n=1 Tax=Kineococcus radiotolerans TaxID=131568 RepID=A0A7W4TKR5_KINRA|nr:hypothetical protein [Kineococcus radiotolerans]MBB2900282.1 hypothetical protein [Kineococcus radiotolerans]